MSAFQALQQACAASVTTPRSNRPGLDQEHLRECMAHGDTRMLHAYGPLMPEIRKYTELSPSAIAYRLNKDERVICSSRGRGTCRRWWIKGYQEALGRGEG